MSNEKVLIGAAGEHYVAFQLLAREYTVGLTARGTKTADLLITNVETGKSLTAQVKTMKNALKRTKERGLYWVWRVGTSRAGPQPTLYYFFVDLKGDLSKLPDVFVVPSSRLEKPPPDQPGSLLEHSPPWCHIYERDKGEYLNRWDVVERALK